MGNITDSRHKLLSRQLKKSKVNSSDLNTVALQNLIKKINQTYHEADKERYWLEQSLTITSQEMAELYEKLAMDSQARIKAISSALPDMMFFVDQRFQVLEVFGDDDFLELVQQKFNGSKLHIDSYFVKLLIEKLKRKLSVLFEGVTNCDFHFQQIRSGVKKYFEVRLIKTDIVIDEELTAIGLIRDVTDEFNKQQEASLINQIMQVSKEAVVVMNHQGQTVFTNASFNELFDNPAYQKIGQRCQFLSESIHDDFEQRVWQSVNEKGIWKGEWQMVKNHININLNMQFEKVTLTKGYVYYIAVINDITELQYSRDELMHVAYHDFLTALPNRKYYYEELQKYLAKDSIAPDGAVLFFDLDRFKTVNDSLGHKIGDQLLIKVADRVSEVLNSKEFFARMGGDEFTVIHPRFKNLKEIDDCAERILSAFQDSFVVDQHEIDIKTSIGISLYPSDSTNVDDLTQFADTAMYDSKNKGGNGFEYFSQSLKRSVLLNFRLEQELRKGIINNELELYFQPQVESQTGKIVSAEALLRWKYQGEYINPEIFIPIAEVTGLINELGLWVLKSTCEQWQDWQSQGLQLNRLAVNLSVIQLADPMFSHKVINCLKEHQVSGEHIEFEITENALVENNKLAQRNINHLSDHNIWISIDDFGTGHSSLSNLRRFPFKTIKIDKSFVAGIGKNQNDEVIIRTTMAMAKELELEVVAEGVETYTQMVFLTKIGCHYQQGYYFSKPKPANDLDLNQKFEDSRYHEHELKDSDLL
jgi:diguanylate cyclase (GGDEF)-like protein